MALVLGATINGDSENTFIGQVIASHTHSGQDFDSLVPAAEPKSASA